MSTTRTLKPQNDISDTPEQAPEKDPYEQYWVMDSVEALSLVGTVAVVERCA